MLHTVHHQSVIDLIRKNNQLMFPCHLYNLFQNFSAVYCTGRIVRVDDDDSFCTVCNLFLNVINIRVPVCLFIAHIMYRRTASQRYRCCPEWIIRCRNQNLISIVQQCLHRHGNHFTDTVAGIDIIHPHIWNSLDLTVLHDRFSRRKQSSGIRISLGTGQIHHHILYHFIRCTESKWCRITNIQFQNGFTIFFHTIRFIQDRSSDIITNVVEFC